MKTKSLFLTGNMIVLLATTPTPGATAFGAIVLEGIRQTPLGPPEIVDGLNVVKKALENEKAKVGVDTERYSVMSQIEDTLIAKAEQAGLTDVQMSQFDQSAETKLDTDVGAATRASQALGHDKLNGGSHSRTGHAT